MCWRSWFGAAALVARLVSSSIGIDARGAHAVLQTCKVDEASHRSVDGWLRLAAALLGWTWWWACAVTARVGLIAASDGALCDRQRCAENVIAVRLRGRRQSSVRPRLRSKDTRSACPIINCRSTSLAVEGAIVPKWIRSAWAWG